MSLYRELDGDVDSLPNLIDEEELLFGGEMVCEVLVELIPSRWDQVLWKMYSRDVTNVLFAGASNADKPLHAS